MAENEQLSEFLTGKCHRCGEALKFPASAAHTVGECPHCGQPTGLVPGTAKSGSSALLYKTLVTIWLAVLMGLAGLVVFNHLKQASRIAVVVPFSPTTNLAAAASSNDTPVVADVAPPKPRRKEMETNDFAISPFRLEKTPGSSLVYVVGRVKNLDGQPRYGVKLEFGLSDSDGQPVGKANDYHQILEPYGEWHFRALVLDSKAVAAHFRSIQEAR
jgi:hypothetical protein